MMSTKADISENSKHSTNVMETFVHKYTYHSALNPQTPSPEGSQGHGIGRGRASLLRGFTLEVATHTSELRRK